MARVDRHESVLNALVELDDSGVLATSPVIELELGYSARSLDEFESVSADRRAIYRELPLSREVSNRARFVQRELVRVGHHRGPGVSDLLIAATAEFYEAVVVHYDAHFNTIAKITGQPVQWIVPPGSVP